MPKILAKKDCHHFAERNLVLLFVLSPLKQKCHVSAAAMQVDLIVSSSLVSLLLNMRRHDQKILFKK